jgi:hypothetical protein
VELTAYLHPGWAPLIRPAPATRAWMDATPESFAYRCLPLNIANAHGWEILSPCGFEAVWDGGSGIEAVTIRPDAGADPRRLAVSLFGQGVLTFHVEAILRTAPGWNLWVSGSPNRQKDAIAPLSAVIETDWSPFTFTMNYKFTRPFTTVAFGADEPYCMIYPVPRGAAESMEPEFRELHQDPDVEAAHNAWAEGRRNFNAELQIQGSAAQQQKWQKDYFKGNSQWGIAPADHRTKVRLKEFK